MQPVLHYLPIALVAMSFLERMREVGTKRDTVVGERKETLTFNLFMLCGVLMVSAGIAEYLLRDLGPSIVLMVVGAACSFFSFVVRRRAIAALGRFWSLHVEIREGHEFVTSGPFRWMRHPVYFSMILELLGPALMLGSWITFAGVACIFVPTMIYRLKMEEAALCKKFGPAYEQYQRSTPLLIPWQKPAAR